MTPVHTTPLPDVGSTNLAVDNSADSPFTTSAGGTTLPGLQTYGVFDSRGNLTSTESANIPAERAWGWDYLRPLYKALGLSERTGGRASWRVRRRWRWLQRPRAAAELPERHLGLQRLGSTSPRPITSRSRLA